MNLSVLTPRNIQAFLFHRLSQPTEPGWVDGLSASIIETDQESESYAGVGSVAPPVEWKGERTGQQLRAIGPWVVTSRLFQTSLTVTRDEMNLDKTGQVRDRLQDQINMWAQHWDDLAIRRIKAAESAVCYDGQFYFDTDHAEGSSGAQSNDLTLNITTPTAPTATEYEDAIWQAIAAFKTLVNDQGYPAYMDPTSFVLVCPPSHEKAVAGALRTQLQAGLGGAQGAIVAYGKHTFRIVAHSLLATAIGGTAWTDKFALFVADGRGLLRQHQRSWKMLIESQEEGSSEAYDRGRYKFGVSSKRELHYGDWKSGILTTFT